VLLDVDSRGVRAGIGARWIMRYEIQTWNGEPGATGYVPWASDTIGDNPPRAEVECYADVEGLRGLGGEWAETFATDAEGTLWRIVEVGE